MVQIELVFDSPMVVDSTLNSSGLNECDTEFSETRYQTLGIEIIVADKPNL